jgi:hypothetical protein
MKKRKPITFKTAAIVVVALHILAFYGFASFSSYRAKLAKEARERKKAELELVANNTNSWPNANKKLKVVAVPTPQILIPTNIKNNVDEQAASIKAEVAAFIKEKTTESNKIKSNVDNFVNQQKVALKKITNKITQRPTPTTKPVYSKTVEVDDVPVQTRNISKRDVYDAMPEMLRTSYRTRDTSEVQTRVVRTYVVLQ